MSKKAKDAPEAREDEPIDPRDVPGVHHGLTEEQIKKIEDARHDDTEGVPPPELPPPEEPPTEPPPEAR
jgi:hypothetical protein